MKNPAPLSSIVSLPWFPLFCVCALTGCPNLGGDLQIPDVNMLEPDATPADSSVPDSGVVDARIDTEVVPPDHCAAFEGQSGQGLRAALRANLTGHRSLTYRDARAKMYGTSGSVDVIDGVIESIYTGQQVVPDGTRTPGGAFNTEHIWPRSEGSEREPALSDLHHIFPCDEFSNAQRDTLPYGMTDCGDNDSCRFANGGSELGSTPDGRLVFEVRPERRGDVARAKFYFAVRYQRSIGELEEAVLRAWHEEDPPDEKEVERNDQIEVLQRNRNPFVDCPEVVANVDDY